MSQPRPFAIHVGDATLERIAQRVRDYRWEALPDISGPAGDWRGGISLPYLRALCDYWVDGYDWRAQEALLNRHPQFTVELDGQLLHFWHVRGSVPGRALLLSHGWPGSAFEFFELIAPLTQPERFGGAAADSFDVVIPCLPGFGFSGRPAEPLGPRAIARLFDRLMTEVLGYSSYIAQGGDWGAGISAWLGYEGRGCRAVHLNMAMVLQGPGETAEEQAWIARMRQVDQAEGGYSRQQGTRPQTLAAGLADSPVGIAAWIVEKFAAWSDLPSGADDAPDLSARYDFDELLTNLMFYVATDSFATSTWIYWAMKQTERSLRFPAGERCERPTAFAAFPDPCFPPAPASLVARFYNLVRYTAMPHGGHFAALEEPDLLAEDIRAFGRQLDGRRPSP